MIRLQRACVFAGILAVMASGAAAAQGTGALEEIIVTATKRGELSVQDIPAGIKAVSGDFLERNELRGFDEIARIEPSLQFSKYTLGDLQPIIRGIQSPGAGTVGVYFDETVITGANFQDGSGRTPDIGAYDLQRVEILKGPQGTLFGASSMTGTVRLISNKPDTSGFDANVAVRGNGLAHGDAGYGADGMVNFPVSDTLALRAVGWHESGGGYIDQYVGVSGLAGLTEREDSNEYDRTGGRIMGRWTPNERFTLDVFGLYQEIDSDGPPGFSDVQTGVNLPITVVAGAPSVVGLVIPPQPGGVIGKHAISTPSESRSSTDVLLFGGTAQYDFDVGSLFATMSKFENDPYEVDYDSSGIGTRFGLLDPFLPPTAPGVDVQGPPVFFPFCCGIRAGLGRPSHFHQTQTRDVLTGELRFSSNLDGPMQFVAGGFYQDDEQFTDVTVTAADPATGKSPCRKWSECIVGQTAGTAATTDAAASMIFGSQLKYDIEAFAFFGHIDYELTDQLTAGGGVRYYHSDEHDKNYTTVPFQGSTPFALPPAYGGPIATTEPIIGLDDETTVSEITWDASLSYQYADNQLYYFRAAKGFRQGGINDSNSARLLGAQIPGTFDPDTVVSLEGGAKTSWYDDRLIANVDYFKMFWDDIQVPGQDPTGSINFVDNATKAEIDGVELELAARPTDQWYLTFGMTWINAELTEDQTINDPQGLGFPGGKDGDDVPKVPEWSLVGSAEYRFPFPLMENVQTVLRTNMSYTDSSMRFFNDSFEGNREIGDYFLMNMSASFEYQNWEFRIFARNVTDEAPTIDIYGSGADAQQQITAEPRAVGAQIRWRYE